MPVTSENKRGSNCTLTDGMPNRILTLGNTGLTQAAGFLVFNNGLQLTLTTEYTVNHLNSSSTVTFLNPVWDSDYIAVVYIQGTASPTTGKYCNFQDVYDKTGLSTTEVSSAIVNELLLDAEAELEMLAGRVFTNNNNMTEYLSIKGKDIINLSQTTVQLAHWPVQSVSLFNLLDMDGNALSTFETLTAVQIAAGTIDTDDYWLQTMNDPITNLITPNGKMTLKTSTISAGINNVKVSYTYGYGAVPQSIKNVAVCLTGIRVWLAFMGCAYNRLDSYSIPQQSVNKGSFYDRAKQNIDMLTEEANRLMDRIGRKSRSFFAASGDAR